MARRRPKTKFSKTNYQDDAMEKEYQKGERAAYSRKRYTKRGSNDPNWYASDPSLLRDAASIPFSVVAGLPIDLGDNLKYVVSGNNLVVPTVMALYLDPSIGYADTPNSAINIAATAMYSFVRHANSGSSNYDAPDLMLYVMAMTQVYSYINYLQRAYGTATLYSQRNRAMPKTLLQAMDIDPSDIGYHLSDFRYGINLLINKAAALAVPAEFTIFQRHAFLYSNIYIESDSVRNQMYMYSPNSFWQFSETSDTGGSLTNLQFHGSLHTVQELLEYGNKLIDPILQSEDMGIMSGDILKAYGGNILKLSPLQTEYPIVPIHNTEVLEQMMNATILPANYSSTTLWYSGTPINQIITGNTSYLASQPQYLVDTYDDSNAVLKQIARCISNYFRSNKIINTEVPEPGPELVVENTRLKLTGDLQTKESKMVLNLYSGTEICVAALVFAPVFTSEGLSTSYSFSSVIAVNDNVTPTQSALALTSQGAFRRDGLLHAFQYRPETFYFIQENVYLNYSMDLDNYTVISPDVLKRLHEMCLMNELHVPSVGKL
nr:capsid protein [Rat picobirnavirus]